METFKQHLSEKDKKDLVKYLEAKVDEEVKYGGSANTISTRFLLTPLEAQYIFQTLKQHSKCKTLS